MSRRFREENPDYGPGNEDYEYDAWRQQQVDDEREQQEHLQSQQENRNAPQDPQSV